MSTVEKIFESLLNNRLSSWLQRKKLLVPTQFGFRDRTGVLHHYFSLNEAVVWRSTLRLGTWMPVRLARERRVVAMKAER